MDGYIIRVDSLWAMESSSCWPFKSYGQGIEAVLESACLSHDAPVLRAGWELREQSMSSVAGVFGNFSFLSQTPLGMYVLDGWEH